MNETITIRFAKPADAEQIAICHVASWQKAYRGHIPDHVLDSLSVKEREHKWHDILNKNANVLVLDVIIKLLDLQVYVLHVIKIRILKDAVKFRLFIYILNFGIRG